MSNDLVERDRDLENLVPTHVKAALSEIPPHLVGMHEHELRRYVKPSLSLDRIRLAFWIEYDAAQEKQRMMNMALVYRGACHPTYFANTILKNPEMLAWIICPPADYILSMKAMLNKGIEKLNEIIDSPLKNEKGQLNAIVANTVMSALKMMDLKVHGAAIHRIESKVMTLSTSVDKGMTDDEINKKLADLRARAQQISKGNIIDVGSESKESEA